MAKAKAIFTKIQETGRWGILVSGAPAKTGDEFRIRKADKTVTTVMVGSVIRTHAGGDVCSIVERKTESVNSLRNSSVIRPAEMAGTFSRGAVNRLARRLEEREGRSSYEIRHQIGL